MAQLKDTLIQGSARVTDTLYASTINGLTLIAEATGFTITGGTTSKTLTVSDTITLKTGTAAYLAYYSAAGTISGHSIAHFSDEFDSSVANKKNELVLGNAIAKATNGSSWGQIALYSPGTKGTNINSVENSTAWYTATLQAKTGTIALTSDIPTDLNQLTNGPGYVTSSGVTSITLSAGAGISLDTTEAITTTGTRTISISGVDTTNGSETQCLTKKGTWKTFGTSNLIVGTDASNAAAGNHVHGNITNTGCITEVITPTNGDYLIIGDSDASGKLGKGPTFVSPTANQFLKDTGAFAAITAADLPAATISAKGAVVIGTGLTISSDTVSVAYGTSANTALEGNTDINKVKQNAASTANIDYPILLASGSDTTLQTDYVNKTATLTYNPNSTILTTPHLTISNAAAHSHLTFSRTTWNYITGPAESVIAFNFGTIGANDSTFAVSATSASPGKSNTYDLGESATRWRAIYANNYVPLARTKSTLQNTAGTYIFALNDTILQINSDSNYYYVGLQIGDDDSKWQLTNYNNTLWFRQNSNGGTNTTWETWTQVLDTSLLDNTISTTIDASHIPTTQAVVSYIAENAGSSIEIIRL